MSEEDAALFWEIGNNPAPDPGGGNVGTTLSDRAAPMAEEAASKTTISIRPVPSDRPDNSRCTNDGTDNLRCTEVCANPADNSQDTTPADSARMACVQERMGALSDDISIPRPSHLQATIGTQIDETTQPQMETLEENETPVILKETAMPGLTPTHKHQNETRRMEKR